MSPSYWENEPKALFMRRWYGDILWKGGAHTTLQEVRQSVDDQEGMADEGTSL